ncbi:MAG: hypothetical protein HF314_14785 [Ignavibacteria bacterium]|jgi:Na+-driven multidrug efflux pump|nr:hypothetical protein [Ignavibacteria bacterium]MCU7504345.1 hypothetical protein [Ignavibacteria bacterium]MCU7517568.1 hypothetical protein [Ignavibacteria bacterium]
MHSLSLSKIFRFWLPLAATWLMMSVEGPYLSAIIARMPNAKYNLAAYGVAFSFAMIVEAPIIMMLSASVAIVKNRYTFFKLRNFVYTLNLIITALIVLFVAPPVFYYVAENLVMLPPEVARLTHIATIILIPWPAAIGYRRFYQGILIRNNMTRRVAYGTIVRLSSMSLTALLMFLFTGLNGAIVGASALSAGVVSEAIASRIMALKAVNNLLHEETNGQKEHLSYKEIINFYYPLALTSILTLAVNPMITFFMGQSLMPLESLAVLPVINSFIFIFKSFGVSYQETAIALIGENKKEYHPLRNFAIILAVASAGALLLIAFLPLADVWFIGISGLSNDLASIARLPLMILALIPALEVLISFQRAMLVDSRETGFITTATAIEVGGIILTLFITIKYLAFVGVVAAALAMMLGRIGANIYLFPPFLKFRNPKKEQ